MHELNSTEAASRMGRKVLKRRPINHVVAGLWIFTSSMFVMSSYRTDSALIWFWLAMVVLYCFIFAFSLYYPEMAIKNGILCFRQHKISFKRWICLPIADIADVGECKREVGGVVTMAEWPTFIFVMKDGRNFEYFPSQKKGKRIDEIRSFLNSIPSLPQVTLKDDLTFGSRRYGRSGPLI